jgi:hypothetical protein
MDSKVDKKNCENCFKLFIVKRKGRRFCSIHCARKNNWKIFNDKKKNITSEQWSEINKNSYKNGKKVGGGTTKWYRYKNIRVQGTYELRTCKILDKWKKFGKIKDWEYTNDRYQYIDVNGKERTYLLDFKIFTNENTFYYVETKGYSIENDQHKWNKIKELGYKLEIWFLENIQNYEIK